MAYCGALEQLFASFRLAVAAVFDLLVEFAKYSKEFIQGTYRFARARVRPRAVESPSDPCNTEDNDRNDRIQIL